MSILALFFKHALATQKRRQLYLYFLIQINKNTYNVNSSEIRPGMGARIAPSHDQMTINKLVTNTRVAAAKGVDVDTNTIVQGMASLAGVTSTTSNHIRTLGEAADAAAQKLSSFLGISGNNSNNKNYNGKTANELTAEFPWLSVVKHFTNGSKLGGN